MITVETGRDEAHCGAEETAGGDRDEAPSGSRGPSAEQQREATAASDNTWGAESDAEATFQDRCAAQHRRKEDQEQGEHEVIEVRKNKAGQGAQHAD